MENVDEIILHQLGSIGIELEDGVQHLQDLNTDAVFRSISECLRIITGQMDLPRTLPPSMSQRYSTCGKLAEIIKQLGYRGDIGYQTILYCSESDIRNVLVFLIEKLPREHAEAQAASKLSYQETVVRAVSSELASQLSRPWIPVRFRVLATAADQGMAESRDVETVPLHSSPLFEAQGLSKQQQADLANMGNILAQARHDATVLAASVIDQLAVVMSAKARPSGSAEPVAAAAFKDDVSQAVAAAALLARVAGKTGKRKTGKSEQQQKQEEDEKASTEADEDRSRRRREEEEAETMAAELAKLKEELSSVASEAGKLGRRREDLEREVGRLAEEVEGGAETVRQREVVTGLLPEAGENIAKLEAAIASRRAKIEQLRAQWLEMKASLESQLDKLTGETQVTERRSLEERLAAADEGRQEALEEAAAKEATVRELEAELAKAAGAAGREVSRGVYTKRILDMIKNTKKQKGEIERIAVDTRAVQKEMNSLGDKVERAFHIADEMVFRDSKRDESARRMYRLLAAMHVDFAATTAAVDDTARLNRELDDTEARLEAERRKGWDERARKIKADLDAMRASSASTAISNSN